MSCAKRIAKTTVIACLAYMSIALGVNAQQDMKIDQFNEVIKQVEELKKTDLVQALQKLIVFDAQLSKLTIEQNLIFFKLNAEIYLEQNQYTIAKDYTNHGLKIAKRLASPSILISELLYLKGFAFQNLGDIAQASDDYKKGLEVAESLHDKVQIAAGLINLGAIAYITDDYERSLVLLNDAYNIARQTNDEELKGSVNYKLGIIYAYLLQDKQSMTYYQKSYMHFKKAGMLIAAHNSLINIATNHIYNKDFQRAINVFKTIISESNKDCPSDNMYNVYSGMARAYLKKKSSNPEAAYEYLLKAKKYLKTIERQDVKLQYYVDESNVLYQLDRFEDALVSINLAEKILTSYEDFSLFKIQTYAGVINLKANILFQQKKYQQAYEVQSEVVTLIDSLYEKEESRSITKVRLQLEAEQADIQNKVLHNQQVLHETSLQEAQLANEEQRLYLVISALIAIAFAWVLIKLVHSQQKLKVAISIDPLTGVDNRRSLMNKAKSSFKQAKAKNESFSLLLIDVDHFKDINDSLGHSEGDKILAQVAHLSVHIMRKSDIFGRFGGESFMVFLPNTPLKPAIDIGERIRLSISRHSWQPNNIDNVFVSIGVVCLESDADLITLIKRADKRLVQAKISGRNKVCG